MVPKRAGNGFNFSFFNIAEKLEGDVKILDGSPSNSRHARFQLVDGIRDVLNRSRIDFDGDECSEHD